MIPPELFVLGRKDWGPQFGCGPLEEVESPIMHLHYALMPRVSYESIPVGSLSSAKPIRRPMLEGNTDFHLYRVRLRPCLGFVGVHELVHDELGRLHENLGRLTSGDG